MVYYLHGDHLGSTSLTTNQSGALVSQARYLPYGETRWGGTGPTDFGFTSQRKEAGLGLYDYNARYYSSVLGRFISPDTVVPEPLNSQEWNRYSYVTNNPLRFKDPTGHKQESGAGVGGNREVYLILAHQYEEAAAAAGDSWRGTLNEYNFALAGKYYSLAEGNLITAQTQDAIIEGPLYTRLATSGYFGAEEQVNAAAEAAGGDLVESGLNSLGGASGAAGVAGVFGGRRAEIINQYGPGDCMGCAKALNEEFGDSIYNIKGVPPLKGPAGEDIAAPRGFHTVAVDEQGNVFDNWGSHGPANDYFDAMRTQNPAVVSGPFNDIYEAADDLRRSFYPGGHE